MKISVQSGDFTYSYDDSCHTKVVDGFEEGGRGGKCDLGTPFNVLFQERHRKNHK